MRTRHGCVLLTAALLALAGPCGAAVIISLANPPDLSNPPSDYGLATLITKTLLGGDVQERARGNETVYQASDWSPSVSVQDRSQLIDRLKAAWSDVGVTIEEEPTPPVPRASAAERASDQWAQLDESIQAALSNPNFDGTDALPALSLPEPAAVAAPTAPAGLLAPYDAALHQAAAESGVSEDDLRALIQTKALFYRRLDPGNLIGLFDRPSAHKAAQALGLDDGPRETGLTALIKDPATNVRLGSWLWAGLLQRFDGNKNRALVAWYTGRDDYRRDRRDPETESVLYVFHGYLQGHGAPLTAAAPSQTLPRPTPRPLQAIAPVPPPPPAVAGQPPIPQGRYWSVSDVENWIAYLNVRDHHGFGSDFLTFVKTIVFTESPHWDHGILEADILARSPTNARGIMQFTRRTGHRYGLEQRRYLSAGRWYVQDDRLDPVKSLTAGMDYLADLYRINGRSRYALMLREIARDYKGSDHWGSVRTYYCRFGGTAVCGGRSG